jgi:hypothetical protein
MTAGRDLRAVPLAVKAAAGIFVLLSAIGLIWRLAAEQMAFPVAALGYFVLCAALAWQLLLRRSWARFALVAIVAFDLALYPWDLERFLAAYRALPAPTIGTLALKALAITAAVLMFAPASNRWFSARVAGAR